MHSFSTSFLSALICSFASCRAPTSFSFCFFSLRELLQGLVVLAFQCFVMTDGLFQVPYETLRLVLDDPDALLQILDLNLVLGEFALE
jgi:hypothetical protein